MLKLYNTMSRSVEEFKPLEDESVKMYSCGPTVYDYQHIGNMRKYVNDDILVRTLQWDGFAVKRVMNITDVGHLVSDEDTGEDKMAKGAKKYGMSAWEVAQKFEGQFWESFDAMGNIRPDVITHATDYIDEQIALIHTLEEKGYTYIISDGVYFDTSKFPDYFKLSRQNPNELKKGARVEFIEGKKNAADFALWKFSPKDEKRDMEWDSPWGKGFPGWHIECSAMILSELGETIDIHTGGIEHITVHHPNEIAQSESATGKQFVKYWVHNNHLQVDGGKMGKSSGNGYLVQEIKDKGFDPLALRYLFLNGHYRQEMNFTLDSLKAAQTAYDRLIKEFASWDKTGLPSQEYLDKFTEALNDDLNTAKAIAIMWDMVKAPIDSGIKAATLQDMDGVLGLGIMDRELSLEVETVPQDVMDLVQEREAFRQAKDFSASDDVRKKIEDLGYTVEDSNSGPRVSKK